MPRAKRKMQEDPTTAELFEAILQWFVRAGHGRLWCLCGHLLWRCSCTKGECPGVTRMVITDHTRCLEEPNKGDLYEYHIQKEKR